jgi:hypothetical protein
MIDIQPIDIDDGLEAEVKLSKTALIDADTLAYTTCLEIEWQEELLPREMYSDKEWKEIVQTPGYVAEEHCIYRTDFDDLLKTAIMRVEEIRHHTSTKDVELYFSSGKTFRHKLCDTYKGNRKTMRYPEGLEWLKNELIKHYNGKVLDEVEADDMVVYLKRTNPDKYVLCAIDKDVLNSVPGKHFDYYYKRMHFVEIDEQTTIKWAYIQCLMGDPSDNVAGLRGIGKKRAEKALAECATPCEYWEKVVGMYIDRGHSIEDAIETMRLVHMHQISVQDGKIKVELWQPPCVTKYERS